MARTPLRRRLAQLEDRRRFLNWFVRHRFYSTLTVEEFETFASGGELPDPLPNRPSRLDDLDQKTLTKRWKEAELFFRGRSEEDLEYYAKTGFWPEQRGGLLYSMEDGNLIAEWKLEQHEDSAGPAIES